MGFMVWMDENGDAEGNYTLVARKKKTTDGLYPVGTFLLPANSSQVPVSGGKKRSLTQFNCNPFSLSVHRSLSVYSIRCLISPMKLNGLPFSLQLTSLFVAFTRKNARVNEPFSLFLSLLSLFSSKSNCLPRCITTRLIYSLSLSLSPSNNPLLFLLLLLSCSCQMDCFTCHSCYLDPADRGPRTLQSLAI